MIELDLGKYRLDYHDFYKMGRNMFNQIEDDSPFKIYETQKNNYGEVFLKIFDKEALKDEDDNEFSMEHIQKGKRNIIFKYCKSDLKEDLFNKGSIETRK